MQRAMTVWFLLAAAACGPSLGPAFQKARMPSDPMKAIVYIYRPSKMSMKRASVFLSAVQRPHERWEMELHSGGYIAYVADAGKLSLVGSARDGFASVASKIVELDLQPHKEYFVRAKVDSFEFAEVTPDIGERELRDTHLDPGGTSPKRVPVKP